MADTIRQKLVSAAITRMQTILVTNGYQTDVGARVFDWPSNLEASEFPCLGVFDLEAQTTKDGNAALRTPHEMALQLRIYVSSGTPATELRKMIGDVQSAVGQDARWGGLAFNTAPKRDGFVIPKEAFEIAGAAVEVTIQFMTDTFNPYE